MSFPITLSPGTPTGLDSPRLGDDEIRNLKSLLADLFTLPVSPSTISATIGSVSTGGKLTITNGTWTADVVALAYGGTNANLTAAANSLVYSTASALALLATGNSGLLVTSGAGVPSIGTDIPTAVTIGGAYVYRGGGTDVAVADGGSGLSSGTSGGVLGYTGTGTLASSVLLTANALVLGGGAGATPTPMASLGTTTTLLHGNAAGAPTFGAVVLTADVSGILPTANGGTGIAYFTAAGPTVARVYTFPDAAATILYSGGALGTPSSGVATNLTGLPAASILAGTLGTGAYVMDTSLTVPTLIGGTGTTSDLNLKTTSGVGATGADMHFLVGNNGATEAMTILNNGNVGIGTANPGATLDVVNPAGTTLAAKFTHVENDTGGGVLINTNWPSASVNTLAVTGFAGAPLLYVVASDSSGNVGIGTANPAALLAFSSAAGNKIYTYDDGTYVDGFGTNAGLQIFGNDANKLIAFGSKTRAGVFTEMMRISSGNVGIGMTPTYQLQLSTDSAGKPSTNTWTIVSDERTKDPSKQRPYTKGLAALFALPAPHYFVYNGKAGTPEGEESIGWNAQELEQLNTKMVRKQKGKLTPARQKKVNADGKEELVPVPQEVIDALQETDLLGVNTHELQYLYFNAIRELATRVTALEGPVKK